MSKLLEWIKTNVKEGANVAEAEEMISRDSIAGVTKEQAAEILNTNKAFISAKDSFISKAIEAHDEKFNSEKLPELLKKEQERIKKELNPDLTPEQKRLGELEAKLAEKEKAEQMQILKAELRRRGKELEYDPDRAERFSIYGDEKRALAALETEADEYKAAVKAQVDNLTKQQFTINKPVSGDPVKTEALEIKYAEAQTAGNFKQMMALKEQMAKS